jgi:hypothetical protein
MCGGDSIRTEEAPSDDANLLFRMAMPKVDKRSSNADCHPDYVWLDEQERNAG